MAATAIMRRHRPARISDIAQAAGVGTATVDRVLNGRGGVSSAMAARVQRAVEGLAARPALRRGVRHVIDVVLPADAGPSTEHLGAVLRRTGEMRGAVVSVAFVEKMNPGALAARLAESPANGATAVAFQALDHPLVRDAVSRLAAHGMPALALMSDLDGSEAFGFVGADNRAAGRTAGLLMGRFLRAAGKVAVLWGGQLYRCHEEREIGFRTLVRAEHPHLSVLDLVSGGDDAQGNHDEVIAALDAHPDLVGIYSVGGGNRGIARALKARGRTGDVVLIGHNLTPTTHRLLVDGTMDAVVHQDMELAAGIAVTAIIDQCSGRRPRIERLPVEIIVRENIPPRLRPPSPAATGEQASSC